MYYGMPFVTKIAVYFGMKFLFRHEIANQAYFAGAEIAMLISCLPKEDNYVYGTSLLVIVAPIDAWCMSK